MSKAKREYVKTRQPDDHGKRDFLRALAEYFCKDQAKMSIYLEMGSEHAKTWARLRSLTPIRGYPTVDEAERMLSEFLR